MKTADRLRPRVCLESRWSRPVSTLAVWWPPPECRLVARAKNSASARSAKWTRWCTATPTWRRRRPSDRRAPPAFATGAIVAIMAARGVWRRGGLPQVLTPHGRCSRRNSPRRAQRVGSTKLAFTVAAVPLASLCRAAHRGRGRGLPADTAMPAIGL